jgi:anti-sigma regulatory factor (Ser/Thr protein kinase)
LATAAPPAPSAPLRWVWTPALIEPAAAGHPYGMAKPMAREEFPPVPGSVGVARRWAVATLGIDGRAAEDVSILVSELVTNSVLHAGLAEDAAIVVEVGPAEAGGWRIVVCDGGGRFRMESAAAGRRRGGRGLGIVAALSTDWGVDENGITRVWVTYDPQE